MRIISGRLGGRNLKTVEGEGYRPAMGKTREALFSMLTARGIDWHSTRVLDLFAGSGSLAFEAISRGAPHALLVEMAPPAVRCLKANIASLEVQDEARIASEDVLRVLKTPPGGTVFARVYGPALPQKSGQPGLQAAGHAPLACTGGLCDGRNRERRAAHPAPRMDT